MLAVVFALNLLYIGSKLSLNLLYIVGSTLALHLLYILAITCSDGEFKCLSGQKCIFEEYKCNGRNDCEDWSDEKGCMYIALWFYMLMTIFNE